MIARIAGTLLETGLTEIIVDVNGVGYQLFIPMSTYDKLPQPGNEVSLLTFMNVREDAIHLYGFATPEEKELFEILITVSGIGAKIALNVLSSMPTSSICSAIANGDITVIKKISGIGKRTAERIVVELRDKMGKLAISDTATEIPDENTQAIEDALLALEQLGFKADKARKTIHEIAADLSPEECSSENLIRKALQSLNQ